MAVICRNCGEYIMLSQEHGTIQCPNCGKTNDVKQRDAIKLQREYLRKGDTIIIEGRGEAEIVSLGKKTIKIIWK